MNVLLVDDERNTRDVYAQLLELAGHQVVKADSAAAAERAIDAAAFDVAFIDLIMGGPDGFEVLEYLKRHQPAARAVIITAYDVPDATSRAHALQAEALLTKPIKWADMDTFLHETHPSAGQRP